MNTTEEQRIELDWLRYCALRMEKRRERFNKLFDGFYNGPLVKELLKDKAADDKHKAVAKQVAWDVLNAFTNE